MLQNAYFLQKSEPIQPKTSNIFPKLCQPTLSKDGIANRLLRLKIAHWTRCAAGELRERTASLFISPRLVGRWLGRGASPCLTSPPLSACSRSLRRAGEISSLFASFLLAHFVFGGSLRFSMFFGSHFNKSKIKIKNKIKNRD